MKLFLKNIFLLIAGMFFLVNCYINEFSRSMYDEDQDSWTNLHQIVYNCDINKLNKIITLASQLKDELKFRDNSTNFYKQSSSYSINNQTKINKSTPLHIIAVKHQCSPEIQYEIIKTLIKHGADIHIKNYQNMDFIEYLLALDRDGKEDILFNLVKDFPSLKDEIFSKKDLFIYAVKTDSKKLLKETITSFNKLQNTDYIKLLLYVKKIETLQLLIQNGIDINSFDESKQNAAFYIKDSVIMNFLVKKGLNINQKNVDGETALHRSVNDLERVEMLIANGADVKVKNAALQTPLHLASNYMIARTLIMAGADVNAKDSKGRTPIYYSVRNKNIALTKLLIKKGADLNLKVSEKIDEGFERNIFLVDMSKKIHNNEEITEILYSELEKGSISKGKDIKESYIVSVKLLDLETGIIHSTITKDTSKLNIFFVSSLTKEVLSKLQNRERIVVASLDKGDITKKTLAYVEESIGEEQKHDLVERKNINAVLKELQFSSSDLVNGKKSVKLGKMVGATKMMFVQVIKD